MSHHVFSHNEDAKFIKPRRPHNTKDVSLKASSLKEFMGYLLIFFEKYKDVYFKNKQHVCFFWNKKMELCYWESLYNDIAELFFKNPDAKTSKYYELLRCLEVQYNITTDSIALSVRDWNKNTYRDVSELSKKEIGWLLDNEIINYNIVLQKHEEYVRNLKETLIPRDFISTNHMLINLKTCAISQSRRKNTRAFAGSTVLELLRKKKKSLRTVQSS